MAPTTKKLSPFRVGLIFGAVMTPIMAVIAIIFALYGQNRDAIPWGTYVYIYGWLEGDDTGGPLFNPFSSLAVFVALLVVASIAGYVVVKRSKHVPDGMMAGLYTGLVSGLMYAIVDRVVRAVTLMLYSRTEGLFDVGIFIFIMCAAALGGSAIGLAAGATGGAAGRGPRPPRLMYVYPAQPMPPQPYGAYPYPQQQPPTGAYPPYPGYPPQSPTAPGYPAYPPQPQAPIAPTPPQPGSAPQPPQSEG